MSVPLAAGLLPFAAPAGMVRRPGTDVRRGFHCMGIRFSSAGWAFTLLFATAAHAQGGASLGRGLVEMSRMFDSASPHLATALKTQVTDPAGHLLVELRLADGVSWESVRDQLQPMGFEFTAQSILHPSWIEGFVPIQAVKSLATVPGLAHIRAVARPVKFAGSVQSQAVAVEKADLAQARGFDGTGIKVGVLSNSYDSFGAHGLHPDAADDIATGDLPTGGVTVLQDDLTNPQGDDEGRAMLQLVHDIAPGAALAFATANFGQATFSNNILALRSQFHADVIVDDVFYFAEPMYSDGLLAQTVDAVVDQGAAYFSSSGNNGLEAYETTFHRVSVKEAQKLIARGKENVRLDQVTAAGHPFESFHDFNEGHGEPTITMRLDSFINNVISFQWDEPFDLGKVRTDYNIYLFDLAGNYLDPLNPNFPGFYTLDNNLETDEPVELLFPDAEQFQIVIARVTPGPATRLKYIVLNGVGESTHQNAPSVSGHTAATKGQSVAAFQYNILDFPEDFSSPGPVTILFDDQGNRLHHPDVRRVPQISGIDGVNNTVLGFDSDGDNIPNFFGTSAAAPDVAAVGALVLQAAGGPGSLKPKKLYDVLQDTATGVKVSDARWLAATFAGPVLGTVNGDFPAFPETPPFFNFNFLPLGHRHIGSLTIDANGTDLQFFNPVNFILGDSTATVASISRTPDFKSITLTFAPGTFAPGGHVGFVWYVSPANGPGFFQIDADHFRGARFTVSYEEGGSDSGRYVTDPPQFNNRFSGAGIVNADAATRAVAKKGRH